MKDKQPSKVSKPLLYATGLGIVFVISFSYIFNSKIDLNGDNCTYYMLATSIAGGHGYSDVTSDTYNPTNVFPPGYPLLMSAVRVFTDSFFLQKVLNGLFLLASVLFLFFFMRKNKLPLSLAFVASIAALLNYRVLHFATMMMSEMSFLFFSVLTLWFLVKMQKEKPFWKDGYFYLAILSTAYCYHIRTQGLALIVAVAGYFLFTKRWKEMLAFTAGFAVCLLPWMLRNKVMGLGQSRYMDVISVANLWRPDEGQLGTGEIISRFFDTFRMLLTKAVPNSVAPYFSVDYSAPAAIGEWFVAVVILALIGTGMWQFGKYKYLLVFYSLATFGVISIFSSPSENRYLTSLLPLLEISLVVGLYTALSAGVRKMSLAKGFSPWILAVLFLFAYPHLKELHNNNKRPFPPAYQNFFRIAEEVHKKLPPQTVICTRKSELFYMFSRGSVTGYAFTKDDKALIEGLIQSNTEYVVLEQLGYASTGLYLYPAIEKHPELFDVASHLPGPDTYLLKFNREKAKLVINQIQPDEQEAAKPSGQ